MSWIEITKGQATAHTAMQPDYQLRDKWVLVSHPLDNRHEGLTNSWPWTPLFLHY